MNRRFFLRQLLAAGTFAILPGSSIWTREAPPVRFIIPEPLRLDEEALKRLWLRSIFYGEPISQVIKQTAKEINPVLRFRHISPEYEAEIASQMREAYRKTEFRQLLLEEYKKARI
jgi:hypothetical protein